MIDLSKIEYRHFNSHDIEDVALCDFLRFFNNRIESVLDVGCHDSKRHYARDAKRIVNGRYDGIDILPDPDTALLLDRYYVKNFMELGLSYDAIISISAIEHAGISTYQQPNWKMERFRVVDEMFLRSHGFVFLTFPCGQENFVPNQYANVTKDDFENFRLIAKERGFRALAHDFYFSEHPQCRKPWNPISKHDAFEVPFDPAIEIQCIGVCSWMRI